MNKLRSFALNHPVVFVVGVAIAWLMLMIVFMGVAAGALGIPYGGATTVLIARGATAACILLLIWRLDWLQASGIARLGRWQVWLLALVGLVYFASASLYSFYGRVAFDVLSLRTAGTAGPASLAAGLNEEILFRGLVLCALIRAWRRTRRGVIGSVLLSSLLFAVLHIMQVLTGGLSGSAVFMLILQTYLISLWWGALVLSGGSIWPAVMLHAVVNVVVTAQGSAVSMIEPATLAYSRVLWFSLPLGILGIGLLLRTTPQLLPSGLSSDPGF